MANDQPWSELGRDLHRLGINSVDIPKKLYEMGWRKTGESTRKIGAIHSDSVILPHQSHALSAQQIAIEQAQRIRPYRK